MDSRKILSIRFFGLKSQMFIVVQTIVSILIEKIFLKLTQHFLGGLGFKYALCFCMWESMMLINLS